MSRASLPPGFRFHPTNVELVKYYLKRKIMGKPLRFEVISEVELYKFAPWDLREKSCLKSRDLEWYFFCPRDRKYMNGPRTNRATEIGYWKTTGKDKSVCQNSQTVGMKKTLVFHIGRAPRGARTNWVMHEYRIEDNEITEKGFSQDAFVLCKIFEKSGRGPKNGEQHGAPFIEEEWEDDDDGTNRSLVTSSNNPSSPPKMADDPTLAEVNASVALNSEVDSFKNPISELDEAIVSDVDWVFNDDEFLTELSDGEDGTFVSNGNDLNAEMPALSIPNAAGVHCSLSPNDDGIFDGLEDITGPTDIKSYSQNYVAYEYQRMISNVNDGCFIQLEDLQGPLVPSRAEYGESNTLCSHTESTQALLSEVDNERCSFDSPNACDPNVVQKVEDMKNGFVQPALAEGGHIVSPTLEHLSSGAASYSKLQCLLGSIPAHPASAAEYPLKGEDPKGDHLLYGSPIHFKAEVTLRCMCGGHLSCQSGGSLCGCCYGGRPYKKLGREPSSRGGGFMFVFILGVISALIWVFLLAMGAKLGRYAWRNIT